MSDPLVTRNPVRITDGLRDVMSFVSYGRGVLRGQLRPWLAAATARCSVRPSTSQSDDEGDVKGEKRWLLITWLDKRLNRHHLAHEEIQRRGQGSSGGWQINWDEWPINVNHYSVTVFVSPLEFDFRFLMSLWKLLADKQMSVYKNLKEFWSSCLPHDCVFIHDTNGRPVWVYCWLSSSRCQCIPSLLYS